MISDVSARRRIDSPIGPLTLVASSAGLAAIGFGHTETEGGADDEPILDQAEAELGEYFAGEREVFTVLLDHGPAGDFRHAVREAMRDIAYGRTVSYGTLAVAIGKPGATRAVGTACRTNQLPIVIPCHRVVRADGTIGGYAGDLVGGLDIKRHLLRLEGCQLF